MTKCYFSNLQAITISELRMAQKNVCIAVAWINFEVYYPIFSELLSRGVSVQIIVNDDSNNARYKCQIDSLICLGARVIMINAILGCGGGVGQYVVNYLKGKYPLKCGQRKIVNMNADTDIEYVQVDVRNRKELIKFCQNCSIVINCTGPSYYLSREIASVVCEHNIDYIDTFGIGIDKEELYNYESTMIIGAGSFPGLSGILPVWIRKEQQESEIRRVNIFAGGNEHITASACADFLLSTFSQFGKIDSYYSHQQIKKTENITERVPLIFPDTAEIMEYLPDEIYLSAEYSRIDELHWYNVQTNSEYRNIIQEALLKLMISQEYEYVNRLAENVKRKLENKREESKTWYRIWLEIETVTEKKNYGYEALDSYKINGRIAAFCAEALCSGICQKGIYWPFEILDAEIVMNSLINEEILIGLKENDKKMQEHDLNYEEGEL